jgi:hypothetical protein
MLTDFTDELLDLRARTLESAAQPFAVTWDCCSCRAARPGRCRCASSAGSAEDMSITATSRPRRLGRGSRLLHFRHEVVAHA